MDKSKLNKACLRLLNRHINKLKEPIEYITSDNCLNVYTHIEAIFYGIDECEPAELDFIYEKLFEMYGKKNDKTEIEYQKAA